MSCSAGCPLNKLSPLLALEMQGKRGQPHLRQADISLTSEKGVSNTRLALHQVC